MSTRDLKQHVIDVVKGAAGAFLMAGMLALLQYLGAQIPQAIEWLGTGGGAVAVIKMTRFHV